MNLFALKDGYLQLKMHFSFMTFLSLYKLILYIANFCSQIYSLSSFKVHEVTQKMVRSAEKLGVEDLSLKEKISVTLTRNLPEGMPPLLIETNKTIIFAAKPLTEDLRDVKEPHYK